MHLKELVLQLLITYFAIEMANIIKKLIKIISKIIRDLGNIKIIW